MSIQSSMNALLTAGAVLGKFAEPNVNSKMLSKQAKRDLEDMSQKGADEIMPLIDSINDPNADIVPLADQFMKGNIEYAQAQAQVVDQLEDMYKQSPGSIGNKARYQEGIEKAQKFAGDEDTEKYLQDRLQRQITRKNILGENADAEKRAYDTLVERIKTMGDIRSAMKNRGLILKGNMNTRGNE